MQYHYHFDFEIVLRNPYMRSDCYELELLARNVQEMHLIKCPPNSNCAVVTLSKIDPFLPLEKKTYTVKLL